MFQLLPLFYLMTSFKSVFTDLKFIRFPYVISICEKPETSVSSSIVILHYCDKKMDYKAVKKKWNSWISKNLAN